jgi:hypothetical protein
MPLKIYDAAASEVCESQSESRMRKIRTSGSMSGDGYATWMRRYAGLDTRGLVGTGAWRDQKSAERYAHFVVSEEARRAERLPTPGRKIV